MVIIDEQKFSNFLAILKLLDVCPFIYIKNGIINHYINQVIIYADLRLVLGDDFTIEINNPKKYLKLLKSIKPSLAKLYDDDKRFCIVAKNVKFFFPKINSKEKKELNFDEVKFTKSGDTVKIDSSNKNFIKNMLTSNRVKILMKNNSFIGLANDETQFIFSDEVEEINEEECSVFYSYGFMLIDAPEYLLQIFKKKTDPKKPDEFWLLTEFDLMENVKIRLLENLVPISLESSF